MRFVAHPFGPHPWSGATTWRGPSVLQLHRGGDWYSVWKLMDGAELRGWHVNFDEPVVRDASSFDVNDLQLDLFYRARRHTPMEGRRGPCPSAGFGPNGSSTARCRTRSGRQRRRRTGAGQPMVDVEVVDETQRSGRVPRQAHHRPHVRTEPRTETAVGSGDPIDELQHLTTLVVEPQERGADSNPTRSRCSSRRCTEKLHGHVGRLTVSPTRTTRRCAASLRTPPPAATGATPHPGASKCEVWIAESAAVRYQQPISTPSRCPGPPGCGPSRRRTLRHCDEVGPLQAATTTSSGAAVLGGRTARDVPD